MNCLRLLGQKEPYQLLSLSQGYGKLRKQRIWGIIFTNQVNCDMMMVLT
jgi:hypothetical protein